MAPLTFLPAAERLKLMPEIDLWVLHRLITLLRNEAIADGVYSINLSSQSICSEAFTDQAQAAIGRRVCRRGESVSNLPKPPPSPISARCAAPSMGCAVPVVDLLWMTSAAG